MTETEIITRLRSGEKIQTVANECGLCRSKVQKIKKAVGIKVKVPRGKDKSKMFVNSKGKLDYKSKYKQFRDSSEFIGF
jgi:hypothetical protein